MAECNWWDFGCKAKQAVTDTAMQAGSQGLQTLADRVSEAAAAAFGALGTLWVLTPTPRLDGDSVQGSGNPLPADLVNLLGYVQWIGLVSAVLALIALGALMGWRTRSDLGEQMFPRLALIAGGVLVLGGASSLVSALVGSAGESTSPTVAFLRGELVSIAMWAAVLSTIIAGIRLIHGNAKAGVSWLHGMATLLLVSAGSAAIAQVFVSSMDQLSVTIINHSLDCKVDGSGNCFGATILKVMNVSSNATASPTGGVILAIVLGIIGLLISMLQIILMIVRGGMLIVLVGVLPLAASATTTEMGRSWFQKSVGWLVAWALYKPAAAIVYAAGFQLVGGLASDKSGILAALSGMALMVASVVALPALLRFVVPMTAVVAGGGGGGAAAGMAMGGVAQGAMQLNGASRDRQPSGAAPAAPAGATGSERAPNGSSPSGGGGGKPGANGSASTAMGPRGAAGAPGAAGGAGGAAAGSGAAAGGGGAAAAGGAAAGPIGLAAAAVGSAAQGAKKITTEAVGEGTK